MNKLFFFILTFLILVQPVMADYRSDADQVVKSAINTIISLLKDNDIDKEVRRDKILKKIESIFDFSLMAKLTLGKKNWQKFNMDEKKEFVKLFTRQLKNTYYSKIEFFTDEKIFYEKPTAIKKKVNILTWVFPKDKKIEILYKLYNAHGKWKIYDAEINGVSIIRSFRSQYKQFLSKNTVGEFLEKLRKQDNDLNI